MAMTPEGKVKAAVKKYLKSLPNVWYFMPMQNGMGVVGIPDFICCVGGVFVGIETKAPGRVSNLSPNQKLRKKEIEAAMGHVLVVDNVEDVKRYFEERGWHNAGRCS